MRCCYKTITREGKNGDRDGWNVRNSFRYRFFFLSIENLILFFLVSSM